MPAPSSDPLTPDTSRQHAHGRPQTVGDQISPHAFQGLDGSMIQVPDELLAYAEAANASERAAS